MHALAEFQVLIKGDGDSAAVTGVIPSVAYKDMAATVLKLPQTLQGRHASVSWVSQDDKDKGKLTGTGLLRKS